MPNNNLPTRLGMEHSLGPLQQVRLPNSINLSKAPSKLTLYECVWTSYPISIDILYIQFHTCIEVKPSSLIQSFHINFIVEPSINLVFEGG